MKKNFKFLLVVLITFIFSISYVKADISFNPEDIQGNTYVIGNHMFTDEDPIGLITERIMVAAKTINSNSIDDMIIYYKDPFDKLWVNALSGDASELGNSINIGFINLKPVSEIKQLNITFNSNGGIGEMPNQTMIEGFYNILNENVFTKDGFKFYGWNTSADGSGDYYSNSAEIPIDSIESNSLTLYAIWIDENAVAHNITYIHNGMEGEFSIVNPNPDTYIEGIGLRELKPSQLKSNNGEKVSFNFVGWYTDDTYKTKVDSIPADSTEDITLYAYYELFYFSAVNDDENNPNLVNLYVYRIDNDFSWTDDPDPSNWPFFNPLEINAIYKTSGELLYDGSSKIDIDILEEIDEAIVELKDGRRVPAEYNRPYSIDPIEDPNLGS